MTNYKAEAQKIIAQTWPIPDAFVAGGAVTSVFTGKEIHDIDVYFKSRGAFEYQAAMAYEDGWWCVSSTKRAVTFSDNGTIIQFMHFGFFPTAQDIFNAFDFTVVMGALDYDTREFVFHDDFLKHNSQRFLRFNPGTRYPIASAARVLKYQDRGYKIGKGDMMKIALACREPRLESWEDLKDQIGGAYGEKIVLENEGKEFTLAAAIEALTVDEAGKELFIANDNDPQPGDALSLLRKLAELKGEEFDEGRYDDEGWVKGYEPPKSKRAPVNLDDLAALAA